MPAGALVVKVCHRFTAAFDDRNLVSFGGLPAVMALGELSRVSCRSFP